MKDLFKKYKIAFLTIIILFSMLLMVSVVRFVFALKSVDALIEEVNSGTSNENGTDSGWDVPEIRKMKKDVYWMEQQLVLAKSDSINLGFNLKDSVIQVQLKGTVLFYAKILNQNPAGFLNSLNQNAYSNFGKIASITSETSTIPKKPIKKVIAPKSEDEKAVVSNDTVAVKPLIWEFSTNNNINVIVTGVELSTDSLLNPQYFSDLIKYNANQINMNLIPKNFKPTLYLWLLDKDAKAIYRALPDNGKIIFRN
jgi:hypothetical protein